MHLVLPRARGAPDLHFARHAARHQRDYQSQPKPKLLQPIER
jgi:hypothetical protein